jgi:DNA repair protein RecN (Recombination protein N)
MLLSLQVRDFAIIDRIDIDFEPGMTVLTGETGAGKSILVDALGLVLGERGSAQLVRNGAQRAEFAAEFDIGALPQVRSWLETQALDAEEECLLRRVVGADGRSRAFINGNAVSLSQLKELGELLLDIHGQHFHQSLGKRGVQRDLLDFFGGLLELRGDVSGLHAAWQSLATRLEHLTSAESDRSARLDLLAFQLQELDALGLDANEYDALKAERQLLQHSGKLVAGVNSALDELYENETGNAYGLLADATRRLEPLLDFDASLAGILDLVNSASIQVAEAAESLRRYGDGIDMDPDRRDRVEERMDAIQALARKHRVAPAELPALAERLRSEHDELSHAEERGRELESQVADAKRAYADKAKQLSTARKKSAKQLSKAVTEAMNGLGMPGGTFDIDLKSLHIDDARASGLDAIEFLISANPGQPLQSLAKIASGGELSRMSLAIQVIVSDGSAIPTMVFDEVDSGVGGGVAEMVGRRLQELGAHRQVLCVTHLPQVASLADQHVRISKVSDGKSTRTGLQILTQDERVEELARMLGGVEITRKTLDHAAEMLDGARRKRA